MNPFELYLRAFQKYVDFTGRDTRTQYWTFALLSFAIMIALSEVLPPVAGLYWLAALLPSLAAAARRLHDTNRSGWWQLIALIPLLGALILIILLALPTKSGPNAFASSTTAPVAE